MKHSRYSEEQTIENLEAGLNGFREVLASLSQAE